MRKSFFVLSALLSCLAVVPAQAQSRALRGQVGDVLVGGSSHLYLGGVHSKGSTFRSGGSSFVLGVAPSVAVFVAPHLALGVRGDLALERHAQRNNWEMAVGPQFVAHVPMSPGASLLPKVALDYRRAGGQNQLELAFNVDLAVHVGPQVSITVGPQVVQEVYNNRGGQNKTTKYGLQMGVLGWL